MFKIEYHIDSDIAPFVNCIMIGRVTDKDVHTNLPFYADGYPGIMFQQSANGFYLLPSNKKLSELFLYGQTIAPISLDVHGVHNYVVVQLYPFASKYLLNVDPKVLNDDCQDLLALDYLDVHGDKNQLKNTMNIEQQIEIISNLMRALIKQHSLPKNDIIQSAIALIIQHKGLVKIGDLLEKLHITERTFERNFMATIGLSPKQFAKIIQFQTSLDQLTHSNFKTLTDVGMDSGFTDQSHFIRSFKSYTGQTPSFYYKSL